MARKKFKTRIPYYTKQQDVTAANKRRRTERQQRRVELSRERRNARMEAHLEVLRKDNPNGIIEYAAKYGLSDGVLRTYAYRYNRGDSRTALLKYQREARKRTEENRDVESQT